MSYNVSNIDYYVKSSAITGMPAKKAYVALAAPSIANHKLCSKADWELVLKSIEFKLVKVECQQPKFYNSSENSIDEDWLKQLNEIDTEFQQQREQLKQNNLNEAYEFDEYGDSDLNSDKFDVDFRRCQNAKEIKVLYRKLSKSHHPDNGGDVETFHRLSKAYNLALERTSKI